MGTERKRTVAQERARLELFREAEKARKFLELQKLKDGLIPPDWVKESDAMVPKQKKIRVTVALDEDVTKWFRRLGPGYQTHVNNVLRMFMLNVISKEQEGYYDSSLIDGRPI